MNVIMFIANRFPAGKFSAYGGKTPTYVIDAFIHQGAVFHNYRVNSPDYRITYQQLENEFLARFPLNGLSSKSKNLEEDRIFFKNAHPTKKSFVARKYIELSSGTMGELEWYLQEWTEMFHKEGLLEDTAIIVTGLAGPGKEDHECQKVFQGMPLSLYDEHLHVPLIVFIPGQPPADVTNSLGPNQLVLMVEELMTKQTHVDSPIRILEGNKHLRWDSYSEFRQTFGLRGPMWQYYARIDDDQNVIEQELYDLNNDYEMKRDRLRDPETLDGQLIDLVNTYKKRIISRYF